MLLVSIVIDRKRLDLELGLGSPDSFLGLVPEDIYCFCKVGGAIGAMVFRIGTSRKCLFTVGL